MIKEKGLTHLDRQMSEEVAGTLRETFGRNLRKIILIGSRARGTARLDSDADFCLVFDGEFDHDDIILKGAKELKTLSEKYHTPLAIHPISLNEYNSPVQRPFLHKVHAEGVLI